MISKRILFILPLVFILFPMHLKSQEQKDSTPVKSFKPDTAYIADYTNKLTGRFFLLYQELRFAYSQPDVGNVVFSPSMNYKAGIAGFYKWFGLGLSYYSPFPEIHSEKYGKTSAIDLRINLYMNVLFLEAYIQDIKGFYIANITGPSGEIYTNPDLETWALGAAAYWVINYKRFSVRAAFIQTERQKKSAGSFILRPNFQFSYLDTKGGLLPPDFMNDMSLDPNENIDHGNIFSLGIAPGYSYTLVFLKDFYLNGGLFAGISWANIDAYTPGGKVNKNNFNFQFSPRVAFGYNSSKWFIGASGVGGFLRASFFDYNNFFIDAPMLRFWVGTRFGFHKKHKKN